MRRNFLKYVKKKHLRIIRVVKRGEDYTYLTRDEKYLKLLFDTYFTWYYRLSSFVRLVYIYNNFCFRYFKSLKFTSHMWGTLMVVLSLPVKQQRVSVFLSKKKGDLHFSVRMVLIRVGLWAPFLRKRRDSLAGVFVCLKQLYLPKLKKAYIFLIKNFNSRQFCFFRQYLNTFKPSFGYVIHRHSYIPRYLPHRRIARTVLRALKDDWQ